MAHLELKRDISTIPRSHTCTWPPSQEEAEMHAHTQIIGDFDLDNKPLNVNFCECCGGAIRNSRVSCTTSLEQIPRLGISTLLFFSFTKYKVILLLINFVVYGIYSMVTDILVHFQNNYKETCNTLDTCHFIQYMGIASKMILPPVERREEVFLQIQAWLGLVLCLVWMVWLIYERVQFKILAKRIDESLLSASDFTAELYNLPSDVPEKQIREQIEQHVRLLFQNNHWGDPGICQIFFTYQLQEEYYHLINMIDLLEKYLFLCRIQIQHPNQNFDQMQLQIDSSIQSLIEKVRNINLKSKVGLYGFIIFDTKANLLKFLQATESRSNILQEMHRKCCWGYQLSVRENILETRRAHEPSDINWNNCGKTVKEVRLMKLVSYIISAGLMSCTFWLIYLLTYQQEDTFAYSFSISILISLVIVVLGTILKTILNMMSIAQRNFTYTDFCQSAAFKITIVLFLNSAVILAVVGYFIKHKVSQVSIFGKSGLIEDAFLISLSTSFLPFIMLLLVDMNFYMQILLKWWYFGDSCKNKNTFETQREINQKLELPKFNIENAYATINSVVFFNVFYSALQPITTLFGAIGLILLYYTSKILILSRYSRPKHLDTNLNEVMSYLNKVIPFIFSFGSLLIMNIFETSSSVLIPNLIAVSLSFLYIWIPLKGLVNHLESIIDPTPDAEEQQKYSECDYKLLQKYDDFNPATGRALERRIEQIIRLQDQLKWEKNQNKYQEINELVLTHLHPFLSKVIEQGKEEIKNFTIRNYFTSLKIKKFGKKILDKHQLTPQLDRMRMFITKDKDELKNESMQDIRSVVQQCSFQDFQKSDTI